MYVIYDHYAVYCWSKNAVLTFLVIIRTLLNINYGDFTKAIVKGAL